MSLMSNSSLSLYHQCPPGLAGVSCELASCNSTFIDAEARMVKKDSDKACPSCDPGFTGLNCNLCSASDSCDLAQKAARRGKSGVVSSGLASINNTLTCHHQPKAVTQNNVQCQVDQPTLSTLFPGNITLTAIKMANVPNWDATGLAKWNASGNSSYAQVFLDGVEQFYCQSTGCSSTNTTTSVGPSAPFGTEIWSCKSLQCYCLPGTKICSNPTFPLANVINALNGSLDFPCNFLDPSDGRGTTECAFSSLALNQFVGPAGLSLKNCTCGQCVSQYDLEQDWLAADQAVSLEEGSHLSSGVTAGLVILGAAVGVLLAVVAWGVLLLHKAKKREREEDEQAVGLGWEHLDYRVSQSGSLLSRAIGSRNDDIHRRANVDDDRTELKTLNTVAVNDSIDTLTRGHILDNVTSYAGPGQLKIIIGASGAGKSSLIDILGGRDKRGHLNGQLVYLSESGIPVHSGRAVRRRIAVVDQDDAGCLPGYMTVRECLSFAAKLSNPEAVTAGERTTLVDSVLGTLALSRIANQRIGDARTRGISGGEARRVSLAVALVARPKILIADECTSGLDAFSAHRVMAALRSLASGPDTGTTVIATLHQPSSDIFHMADSVLLLDRGTVAFDGRPMDAIDFCQRHGMPVAVGYNVADSLLSYVFQRRRSEHPTIYSETGPDLLLVRTNLDFHHGGDRPITTFMTQLHALLGRAAIMTRRDLSGPATHILGSALVSVLTGACFYQVKLDIGGFQNRVGSIFFIFILLLFTSLSALTLLAKSRLLMMRERANGLYSPTSWVSSHLVYDLILLRLIPSILIVTIVYWMVGLHPDPGLFFQFLLITVVFNWTVSIYQMSLAALFEEASTAILYGALFILFNLGFAGFILNLQNVPAAIRWLKWLCPSKYALEAVASNELSGLLLVDNLGGVPITSPVSLFSFKLFGFVDHSYYRNLIILSCGFLVPFSLFLFAAVYWRMRERR